MFGTGLRARHFRRYLDVALLLRRLSEEREKDGRDGDGADALADLLESRGPTFIKLGQLLSTRADLLPPAALDSLARLQDKVDPFPFEQAQAIIEAELETRIHKVFRRIGPDPIAAASLAQTYRAELRDGRQVAVKVQRPDLLRTLEEDLAALGEAAAFIDRRTRLGRRYEFSGIVDEMRRTMLAEIDFLKEADNLRLLAENLRQFELLVIPAPHDDFSTGRVLTMDFIEGRKVTALTPLDQNELEGAPLADQLFRAYLKQILVDGFFHADPHPGNVVLTKDNRVALLDLGMVARLGPEFQKQLLTLLLAVSEGRAEDAADQGIAMSGKREGFDPAAFRARIKPLVLACKDASVSEVEVGRVVLEIAHSLRVTGLRPPQELTMIGKALLNLDQVVTALDPAFEPAVVVREESAQLARSNLMKGFSRANATAAVLGLAEFAEKLPDRLGKLLDAAVGDELRIKVDTVDERLLIEGMQKIANRIALGVVLASMIIGAALLMRVETTFRILEYPGLAILLFLAAAVGGVMLIVDILYYDGKRRR